MGPTGSASGSTIAPTTESVEALRQRASAASEAKEAAEAEIVAAAEKKTAAESVSSELGTLDMNNFKDGGGPGRRRRQSETTTAYAKPGSCAGVKTAMDDITNALDGTNDATYNPTKAVAIVAILKSLTATDLNPSCSTSDVADLESAKESAASKAAEVVATQTNKIAKATEEFNAAVALINAVNEALASQGATT